MIKRMSMKIGIFLVSFALLSLCVQTGLALDELLLTGIVRSIDKNNGTIGIQITSEGCRGLRLFKLPDDVKNDMEDSLKGKKIVFSIDSSRCEQGKTYNIVFKE